MSGNLFENESLVPNDRVRNDAEYYADIPIIIHIGLHKTATTWLQTQFLTRNSSVVYCEDNRVSHAAFLTPRFGDFSIKRAHKLFAPYLQRARSADIPMIVSDEALGGLPFHQRFLGEQAAIRLHRAFPCAIVLITIREQYRILQSLYGEYLRYGYASCLSTFLEQDTGHPNIAPILDLEFYSYYRKWRLYSDIFGKDRVKMLPMEWLLKNPEIFAAQLSDLAQRPIKVPKVANATKRVRPASSRWAQKTLRFANHFVPQDSKWRVYGSRFSPNSIAYQVDRLTPSWAADLGRDADARLIRKSIGAYYADSNKRASEAIGMDLSDYGYVTEQTTSDTGL